MVRPALSLRGRGRQVPDLGKPSRLASDHGDGDPQLIQRVSLTVSALAAVAIAVHLIWPHLKIDIVTVALLVFGCLPWLGGIVQSISLPGGPSIEMRQSRARVIAREERESTDAVRVVGSNTGAGPAGERIREIQQLGERYETIRREMPSGGARTREMGKIARQILGLLPVTGLDVPGQLRSPHAGQRLTAYLSQMAEPADELGEQLIETLTEREGIPYNQSWALRAIGRIIDLHGPGWVSSWSLTMLTGMRDGLRQGSDRQLMLADLVDRLTEPDRAP